VAFHALGILLAATTGASANAETYRYWKTTVPEKIDIVEVAKFHVDEFCARRKASCKALTAYKLNPSKQVRKHAQLKGHPASDHCESVAGSVQILTDSKLNQANFCQFEDGSLVDSWDLFSAYQKRVKGASR